MKTDGFTLVEVVVMIAVFGILGLIITDTLTTVLKGQSKVGTISEVKQHGQVVLDKLEKTIREADRIACANDADPNKDALVIVDNGIYTRYKYVAPVASSSNGYIAVDNKTLCDEPLDLNVVKLNNDDPVKGISIQFFEGADKLFVRNFSAGFKDVITIQFRANSGVLSQNTESQILGGVKFETTVELR